VPTLVRYDGSRGFFLQRSCINHRPRTFEDLVTNPRANRVREPSLPEPWRENLTGADKIRVMPTATLPDQTVLSRARTELDAWVRELMQWHFSPDTGHGDEVANALADRLARIDPRPADDPEAVLAPFADPAVAERISATIDQELRADSEGDGIGRDVSAEIRGRERVVTLHGGTYLLPTVIRCDPTHPLANREYLFPYVSVVEVSADQLPSALGPSLVVTGLSRDERFREQFVASPLVDRLNLGAIPTTQIGWDQPHEGNLFDHLYARRAIQRLA